MKRIAYILRIVRHSAANGAADFRATYTWKSWTFGWLARMLTQVVFFVVAGRALGATHTQHQLLVSNAVTACVIETMAVVSTSARERRDGTLPLLVAAPPSMIWVFFGRGTQHVVSGTLTSVVALLALGPLYGVSWSWSSALLAVPAVILTALANYCLGLALSGLVLSHTSLRGVAANAGYIAMMAVCGVQVPVAFWPLPVQVVAYGLPLTYGIRAVQALSAGQSVATAAAWACGTVLAGCLWFLLAAAAFRRVGERGRRSGSIEFSI
ncbi:ABC transporter permease [Streptomyces sp. PTM05]|uniref:ABC transporter permease n=1 Tax=Streptantibioticus parmotrematis TaxID=2873249 RepID=A0ABS7QWE2_9ACTN|nr:ABC transporter permease [Streptantibioticus parmotrematis]MBY8887531.1 ABC transporter permease [Streptantibioticus parmotrematis]